MKVSCESHGSEQGKCPKAELGCELEKFALVHDGVLFGVRIRFAISCLRQIEMLLFKGLGNGVP